MVNMLYDLNVALFMRKITFDDFEYIDGGIFPVFVYSSNRKYNENKTFAPATVDSFVSAIRKLSDDYILNTNEEIFKIRLKDYFRWFNFPSDELKHCVDIFHYKKYDLLNNKQDKKEI